MPWGECGLAIAIGFNATFGLSNKVAEAPRKSRVSCCCEQGIRNRVLSYVLRLYFSMEGGAFELVHKPKLCKPKKCAVCDVVAEQIKQEPMRTL